jgi:hypothetical protein
VNCFEVISDITDIETIAVGSAIRDLGRLRKIYGRGRWRKVKGTAMFVLEEDASDVPRFTGTRHMELAGKNLSANAI